MTAGAGESATLYTVGHSTRSAEEFVRLLRAHGIECVADVRTLPRSRRNPQFDTEALARTLAETGIEYVHLPRLGGLRRPRRDSRNTGLRSAGFRGYADHMETEEFEAGVTELLALAGRKRTAFMCAEALWWRCHRSLLSDALVARGIEVRHILGEQRAEPHRLTPCARIVGARPTYPAEQDSLF